jgi:hypothetical protein
MRGGILSFCNSQVSIGLIGDVPALAPAVYHVAQNQHANDRQRGMMVKVGTLEATCRTRR